MKYKAGNMRIKSLTISEESHDALLSCKSTNENKP